MKKMKQEFSLQPYGPHLWTRDLAREIRGVLQGMLDTLALGDVLVIDLEGIEAFDFSFANELFGRTLLNLPIESPGRFVVVTHLNPYTRENLAQALASLGLIIVEEEEEDTYALLGKVHPTDQATFEAVAQAGKPVAATELADRLGVTLTAMNERLSKLVRLAIVGREKSISPAGREQYLYSVPF